MPLLAQAQLPISTRDLISYCYDNCNNFDQDKPIYVDCANPDHYITANQAYTVIRRLVAGFHAAGLEKGDVVCIHSFNHLYYPILVHGIVASGGVFVGTNPAYTRYELHHALKTSKAKFVIAEPELLGNVKSTALDLGMPHERILILADPSEAADSSHTSWRTLLTHGSRDWLSFDDLHTAQNTPAFLLFSSGTTGLPKAAILSHYNLVAQHTLVHENPDHPEPYHMSRIVCLPMFHAAIGPYTHITTLRSGRESYIMRRFAMPDYLENMRRFNITSMIVVPPMVVAMVNFTASSPARQDFVRNCLRSVKAAVSGAAPLDAFTQAKLRSLLPAGSAFTQLWGMTETSCVAAHLYYPQNDDTGSLGRILPNLDVKLVDPDDPESNREVGPFDTRGELCIRGPTVIKGYLDNAEANARDWDTDGFFHSGDILYCDSKTKLWYIVDRRKELIKVRGFQVAPNEIEGVLLSHPGIADAAVIGIPDTEKGSELPRAYVVRVAGAEVGVQEVQEWVGQRLARYKQLAGGVKFVETIPKTASGKILKRVLREEAKNEGIGSKL